MAISNNILPEDDVYLFFSFDLVNSTKMKTLKTENKNWYSVFKCFYDKSYKLMYDSFNASVWKISGDEVLFYRYLKSYTDINNLLSTLTIVKQELEKELSERFTSYTPLNVKITVWTGFVHFVEEDSIDDISKYENIGFNVSFGDSFSIDFLGTDIDTGFRIAKYTDLNVITLSIRLVYLLQNYSKELNRDNTKIVNYRILKGVWNNNYYPIIWYLSDWNNFSTKYFAHKDNEELENCKFQHIDNCDKNIIIQVLEEQKCIDDYKDFFGIAKKSIETENMTWNNIPCTN